MRETRRVRYDGAMSSTPPAALQIEHEATRQRFVARLEEREAVLQYRHLPEGRVDFRRTFVPPEFRGRGIAGAIVEHGLEWAETEGLRVVPSCSYVATYIERNPRFAPLVADGG